MKELISHEDEFNRLATKARQDLQHAGAFIICAYIVALSIEPFKLKTRTSSISPHTELLNCTNKYMIRHLAEMFYLAIDLWCTQV